MIEELEEQPQLDSERTRHAAAAAIASALINFGRQAMRAVG